MTLYTAAWWLMVASFSVSSAVVIHALVNAYEADAEEVTP